MALSGCVANAPDGPIRESIIWSGFNYSWDQLSHRVALTRAITEADETLSMGLIGGDWSTGSTFTDTPLYRMRYQRVSSRGFVVVHGQTQTTVGPDGALSTTDHLTDVSLTQQPNHVVVLRGFEINTDIPQNSEYPTDYDPALGYTSRGFGFQVSQPDVESNSLSFSITGDVRWGPQDREDMNAAIAHAQTSITVAWSAIGYTGTRTDTLLSATTNYPHDPPFTVHEPFGSNHLPIYVDGTPGVVGLTGFDLEMSDQAGTQDGGYLRNFGFEVVQDARGVPTHATAECTNSSAFEEIAIRVTPSANVVWINLDDPDAQNSVIIREGEHDVGSTTISIK